jgi:tRNA(Ile)-lysidine synthase TilS/MesJ
MEPYTRKYGVKLVYEGDYDLVVNPLILDDQVNNIFEGIFKGEGLNLTKRDDEIYPLVNVSLDWINSFLQMDGQELIECENSDDLAHSFSEFLDDVAPQYKENVVSASEFVSEKLNSQ